MFLLLHLGQFLNIGLLVPEPDLELLLLPPVEVMQLLLGLVLQVSGLYLLHDVLPLLLPVVPAQDVPALGLEPAPKLLILLLQQVGYPEQRVPARVLVDVQLRPGLDLLRIHLCVPPVYSYSLPGGTRRLLLLLLGLLEGDLGRQGAGVADELDGL